MKLSLLFILLYGIAGCSFDQSDYINRGAASIAEPTQLRNAASVPDQQPAAENIRSIELFKGTPGSLPVITLNSSERLTLRFDELNALTNSFRVRLTHHNADWSESRLISNFFQRGFNEDTIVGGNPGTSQKPSYHTYTYTFPNQDFGVLVSGNFMLHIHDYNTGEALFSVPFFVKEDRGGLSAEIEEFFDFGTFPNHQVFATFRYPEFITIPQMDLSMYFVQNQFWGRFKKGSKVDASTQGQVRIHNPRDDGFYGRYEFRPLILSDIQSISRDILEIDLQRIPPLVRLQYDVIDLDVNPRPSRAYRYGQPRLERHARYAEVEFNLERPSGFDRDSKVYIYGSFNNWEINENNRMTYHAPEDIFRGTAIIKEGRYDYKYAVVEDNRINDIRLDAFFSESRQDYQVLVYYHDRQQQFDRLLQLGTITSR